jgi:hypothetical protein
MVDDPKETTWQTAVDRVKKITDKLDMPVDPEIVETVAILQLMGIDTSMSCGGHEDRITGGPYVMFTSKEAEAYRKKCANIGDPRDSLYKEFTGKAMAAIQNEQAKLYPLLDKFYSNRATPFAQRLMLRTLGLSVCRLECQGADMAVISKPRDRITILTNNRKEMADFTEFLKKTYLEG